MLNHSDARPTVFRQTVNTNVFAVDTQRSETVEELEEGTLRNLGSVTLFARIVSLSRQVNRSKDVNEQNALLAKQNVTLAGLVMAMGKFLEKSNR